MKETLKITRYHCDHCNDVIAGGVSCLLANGSEAFATHRFCSDSCLVRFVRRNIGSQTVCMRDLKPIKKFNK